MRSRYYFFFLLTLLWACNNIEDAKPAETTSFFKIFEGLVGYEGVDVKPDADGYVILGRVNTGIDDRDILVIKTDPAGRKLWESRILHSDPKSITVADDGYLIVGDGIQLNPQSGDLDELKNTAAHLIKMDLSGTPTSEYTRIEALAPGDTVDFHGSAVAVVNGGYMFLGSFKTPMPDSREKSFVTMLDDNLAPIWNQSYELLDRDYYNCNSLFISNDNLLWASTSSKEAQSIASEYLSVLYAGQNTTFKNNDLYGENDARSHSAASMQKSGYNYGIVGTYAGNNNENANIYFIRVNQFGNILPNSVRYFDGQDAALTDRDASSTQDKGMAIAGLSDGGYILGAAMLSTPEFGEGENDILLIRLDALGNELWRKYLGGSGDEVVTAVHEAPDGGIVLTGTNTVNGLKTIFFIKTDRNGEL